MSEIQVEIRHIFNHVEYYKCLCSYTSDTNIKDFWYKIYQLNFEKYDVLSRKDNQLLCISFIKLVGEIYTNMTSKGQSVCITIQQLYKIFASEDLWNIFIYHLKNSKNKYLSWAFVKSFCVVLYACNESTFSRRIQGLLDDLKENMFAEDNINTLDFLSTLIDYNIKSSICDNHNTSCNKVVPSTTLSFKDLFQSLSGLLSEYWPTLIKQFHEITTTKHENRSLNRFLILWQKLVGKHREQHLFHTFLNEQFVIAFSSNAYNLNVISLRIYVDIIMQFFISNEKLKPTEKSYNYSLDAAITAALDNNFFDLLPRDYEISGFCILTNRSHSESALQSGCSSLQKCDSVIVKKVTFIFLSLIADVKDRQLLCSSVSKVFDFVKQNFDILPDTDVYMWILDIFIDQDDILLSVVLALLKIYIILKEDDIKSFPQCAQLQNSLNPHKIFISFIQKIGFDHNELLSFLVSDETCFLLYLLLYLKLLLKEWDIFLRAHSNLIKAEEDVPQLDSTDKIGEESSVKNEPPVKKMLVSYSSSSSEEDLPTISSVHNKNQNGAIKNNFVVITTLIKLKDAIQKLVDAKEFPYNVLPLIALLQACEDHCLSL